MADAPQGGRGRGRGPGRGGGRGMGGRGAQGHYEHSEVTMLLQTLGFPEVIYHHIRAVEGIRFLDDFRLVAQSEIDRISTRLDTAGIPYTALHVSMIKALYHMIKRCAQMNVVIAANDITHNMLIQELDMMNDSTSTSSSRIKPQLPDKFKSDGKWRVFKDALNNYLSRLNGKRNVPLTYVTRPAVMPHEADPQDPIWTAEHNGPQYKEDNKDVFNLLEGLTLDGPGETYIRQYQATRNGRAAFLALDLHFGGGSYQTTKINNAWRVLRELKYDGRKSNLDFSTFRKTLDDAFRDLDEGGEGLQDPSKVTNLLSCILGETNPSLENLKNYVLNSELSRDYTGACNYFARCIANNPNLDKISKARTISSFHTNPSSNSRDGHLPDDVWHSLSSAEKAAIRSERNQRANNGKPSGRTQGRGGRRDHGARGRGGGRNQAGRGFNRYGPNPGGRPHEQGQGRGYERKPVKNDRNVSMIENYDEDELEYEEEDEDIPMDQAAQDDNQRRRSSGSFKKTRFTSAIERESVHTHRSIAEVDSEPFQPYSRAELDTHADNCVLGRDAVVLESYPDQVYKVYGYRREDGFIEKSIVKAALAIDIDGETIILVINQCFHDPKLPNSLLNQNQIRAAGHLVHDVPRQFDAKSLFSITLDGNVTVPLSNRGCIVYFPVRKPTGEELTNARHIELTDPIWDPRDIGIVERSTADITIDDLSKRLLLAKPIVEETLKVTTRYAARVWNGEDEPSYGRYGHRFRWLSRRRLSGVFFTDTFFCIDSADKNNCAQIFINEYRYVYIVPMKGKGDAPLALRRFLDDVGLPEELANDNAKEQVSAEWNAILREFGVKPRNTEAYGPRRNYAENGVRLLKFRALKIMEYKHVPHQLWDHCVVYAAALLNKTVHKTHRLEGRTPFEFVHGMTPDLSAYFDFGFYDRIWYIVNNPGQFPQPKRKLGRWLGPSRQITSDLVYKVLTDKGYIFHTSAVSPVTPGDMMTFKDSLDTYDKAIRIKYGPIDVPSLHSMFKEATDTEISEIEEAATAAVTCTYKKPAVGAAKCAKPVERTVQSAERAVKSAERAVKPVERTVKSAESAVKPAVRAVEPVERTVKPAERAVKPAVSAVDIQQVAPVYIKQLRQDIMPSGGAMLQDGGVESHGWEAARVTLNVGSGTVLRKKRNIDGDIIGCYNCNPIIDSTVYEVILVDGGTIDVAAHTIAEAIFDTTTDGFEFLQLDSIIDHYNSMSDYTFLVRWRDQSESVVDLKTLKSSYPIELSKYATDHGLASDKQFSWCTHVLRKERHFKKVKSRIHRRYKFGVQIPRNVEEALRFDEESNTTYWRDALNKEMETVDIAFAFEPSGKPPPGYKYISCHMIFDVKPNGARKCRFVAGGHLVDANDILTYSSVVSRDSIRILLTVAALNGLDILSTDIQGAYLYAKPKEKVCFIAGREFGPNQGKLIIIVRALYGLKSSGAAFRSKLAADLRELGYRSSLADPDVWLKNRGDHWEYLLVYVDDVLLLSKSPEEFMKQFKELYKLKAGFNKPQTFLGADISYFDVTGDDGLQSQIFGISSKEYILRAIANFIPQLQQYGLKLTPAAVSPIRTDYHPETDDTEFLDGDQLSLYQSLLGTLRWLVELGRIDIAHSVAVMSTYLSCPRYGHLLEASHILSYLRNYPNYVLLFDPAYPQLDSPVPTFDSQEWKEFYPDAKEPIPPNAPEPKGNPVTIHAYVDADHAGNLLNRRSHSGILIYINSAPVIWLSKKQKTIETSTHGAELVATRMAVELVESLRYKCRMFGIPIDGSTIMFCDNASVVHNASRPDSVLKKKHNSISFHRIRECVTAGFVTVVKIGTSFNLSDILTKSLSGVVTEFLSKRILSKLE